MVIKDIYQLQRSEPFYLGARQEISVDLSLKKAQRAPCTVLKGYVYGKCGRIGGATVKVFDRGYKPLAHTISEPSGAFIFENILHPGEYKVMATATGYKVSAEYSIILEEKYPRLLPIGLVVSDYVNMGTVYGVVYNELNAELADAEVRIADYCKPDSDEAITHTNEDGEFLVYGLEPKKYWITALKEGYQLPQKIHFEILPNEITSVNLFLYPDGSSADGTVSGKISFDGKSVPYAVAALYKAEGSSHFLLAAKETNESGFYLFPDVKPGEYYVKSKKEEKNNP